MGRKGEEVKLENVKLKIVDTPYEKGCVKALIEITSNDTNKGKAVLKVWNLSKNGGTIQITRSKGESYENVKILAEEAIQVLLEDSKTDSNKYFKEALVDASKIEEENVVKRLKTPKQLEIDGISIKKKAFRCDECNIERATKKTLNNHKDKKHKGSIGGPKVKILRFKCEHCGIEQSSSRMLRNHLHETHIGITQLAGAKRTVIGNVKPNENNDTSPLKKKKKSESQDIVDEIEAMDDNELSTTLQNFAFSKVPKIENCKVNAKNTENTDLQELSRKQDEKVLNKRRLEEAEELKVLKRKEDDDSRESNRKKTYSTRKKKVAIRKKGIKKKNIKIKVNQI